MRFHLLSLLAAGCGLFTNVDGRAEVRVVGTDLLGVEFSKALYDCAGRSRMSLALAFDGSRPGLDRLKSGQADLAMILLPAGEEHAAAGFESVVVAYQCVVVLVAPGCPLERITLEQLAAIFGTEGPARGIRWSELGVDGESGAGLIMPSLPEVGTSLTSEYFRQVVLRRGVVRPGIGRYRLRAELASLFAGESRVLAIAPTPPGPNVAKVVAVAMNAKRAAFLPTCENVHAGDYGLRMPMRLVFRREARTALRPLLRFLQGDEAATPFAAAGMVPLPPAVRAERMLALDKS